VTVSLARKTKTALDEERTLMLGAQILLGFQLQAPFQSAFGQLTGVDQWLELAALLLMTLVIAILIAPSARHRIVEDSEASQAFNDYVTRVAALTLAPFALALVIDLSIVLRRIISPVIGTLLAAAICLVAVRLCYGKSPRRKPDVTGMSEAANSTSVADKIRYVLTETRVILPGAQALIGFQLVIVLTDAFASLPHFAKILHAAALCLVTLSTAFLIAPASTHRIAYEGADAPEFYRRASKLVLVATVLLALGLGADIVVITGRITGSWGLATALGISASCVMLVLWLFWPLLRKSAATEQAERSE
jgi:Family of unknown function (DUF6328)